MSATGRILFKLTPTSLIVANTGRPFTKRGLAAVVYGSLTTKADVPDVGLPPDEPFGSSEDAKSEVFSYIEGYYNRIRLHSGLGYKSPLEFEKHLEIKNKLRSESFVS